MRAALRVDELRAGDVLPGRGVVLEVRPREGRWHVTYRGSTGLRMVLAREPHSVYADVERPDPQPASTEPTIVRDSDGMLTIVWPDPSRVSAVVAREVLEGFVDDHNALVRIRERVRRVFRELDV